MSKRRLVDAADPKAALARAEDLVREALKNYLVWQQGDGDAGTFVDWVRDEVRDEPAEYDRLHDLVQQLRREKRALHEMLERHEASPAPPAPNTAMGPRVGIDRG
jgi:hypothetical protein